MNRELPFDSIESAHEFVSLFAQVVLETKREIEADIQREMSSIGPRRLEALQIVAYKLGTLELHLTKSRRFLNDLRSLRRLLFGERTNSVAVRPKSGGTARAKVSFSSPSPRVSRSGVNESAVAREASSYARVRKRAVSSGRSADVNPGAADTVPWYVRQDLKPIEKRRPPERN